MKRSSRDAKRVRRVVVKVGSAVIAGKGRLRSRVIANLADDVAELRKRGTDVVFVMSGAIAAGYAALGCRAVPAAVLDRQAAAAIGQPRLMATVAEAFAKRRIAVAQVLMSAHDIEDRKRFISARHTLQRLLERDVVPIINENDALSEHEATIGDNDHLAALVTNVASAELLVILSRVRGVLERSQSAANLRGRGASASRRHSQGRKPRVIPRVEVGSRLDEHIRREVSESGVGGMAAKLSAAHLASDWGVRTIIAQGRAGVLRNIVLASKSVGTEFVPRARRLSARKRWIAVRNRSLGAVRVDAGAQGALLERGASLLPTGVVAVDGDFQIGARVNIIGPDGDVFAVGLVSYGAAEIRKLAGRKASEIRRVLGYEYVQEIVHRDDLVLLTTDQSRAAARR